MTADLVAFLRARLDAKTEIAENARRVVGRWPKSTLPPWQRARLYVKQLGPRGVAIERFEGRETPEEVLADVAAKRAILNLHSCMSEQDWPGNAVPGNTCRECGSDPYPCDTVRLLVQPHSGHPKFHMPWLINDLAEGSPP